MQEVISEGKIIESTALDFQPWPHLHTSQHQSVMFRQDLCLEFMPLAPVESDNLVTPLKKQDVSATCSTQKANQTFSSIKQLTVTHK